MHDGPAGPLPRRLTAASRRGRSRQCAPPRSSADTIHGHDSLWRSTIPRIICRAWSRTAGTTCCSAHVSSRTSSRLSALAATVSTGSASVSACSRASIAATASSSGSGIVVVATAEVAGGSPTSRAASISVVVAATIAGLRLCDVDVLALEPAQQPAREPRLGQGPVMDGGAGVCAQPVGAVLGVAVVAGR